MKVILLDKVPGLGDIDDIKEVSDGYAFNFLFPKHLAVQASNAKVKELKDKEKKRAKDAEKELKEIQSLADRLDGYTLIIEDRANEEDILYAAITPMRIAEALKTYGFPVNKNMIISEPLKEAGEYKIKVKMRHGLEATINLIINVRAEDKESKNKK
ncbi:MAG TPA: 50S ribosomal protein L9 [Candidatus Magasanikbacteria bacterium]|nr:50S ribosomal protein L9 [Candidatus Magasanikbacteria bacterium]